MVIIIIHTMKAIETKIKKGNKLSFEKLTLVSIIYEREDDGFLLECEVENAKGNIRKQFSIDFHEWNNILGKIKDPFINNRLQDIISEKLFNGAAWINTIYLPEFFGKSIGILHYNFENTYYELRA